MQISFILELSPGSASVLNVNENRQRGHSASLSASRAVKFLNEFCFANAAGARFCLVSQTVDFLQLHHWRTEVSGLLPSMDFKVI